MHPFRKTFCFYLISLLIGWISLQAEFLINELDSDTPGSDTLEFIELFDGGTGNTPLDGLVLVFFNGNGDLSYRAVDLDGCVTDTEGFFVLGNPDLPEADQTFPAGSLQNGADAVSLYSMDRSDFPNGTPLTMDNLIDAVVYGTGDATDDELLILLEAEQIQVDENGEDDKDHHSLQRIPNGSGGARRTDTFRPALPTPGANNSPPVESMEIFEVQGTGMISSLLGQFVSLSDNVVTGITPNGYFLQTPNARSDSDAQTSDGLFVYTAGEPLVQIGDQVNVSGQVVEYEGLTEIQSDEDAVILSSGNPLPSSVQFDAVNPSPDQPWPEAELERYEGMRALIHGGIITGPTNTYGEAWIAASAHRAFREPGIRYPGQPALPFWDGNPEIFRLDPEEFSGRDQNLCAGTKVDSVEGILTYAFGAYQLISSGLAISDSLCFRPVRPKQPDEMTIGTLNLFHLMDALDDPDKVDEVLSPETLEIKLNKRARYIVDGLRCPDILAVQEVENLDILEQLADRIHTMDSNVKYSAYLKEGNDIGGIDVGFLVRDNMEVDSMVQVGKETAFSHAGTVYTLHDRPPLVLYGHVENRPLSIMNVHLRSFSGIEGADSSRVRAKRHAQAVWIAERIAAFQEANPEWGLIVLGDFNAYQFTDGYVDVLGQITGQPDPGGALVPVELIVDPPLLNQIFTLPDSERYSYVYQGSAQVLDHILISETLDALVTNFSFARGNADAPELFESDVASLLRVSDHDGCVLYLNTGLNRVHSSAVDLDFRLESNFPNPFNAETQINFNLPALMSVTLSVWNLRGRKVVTLTDGILSSGPNTCQWNGKDDLNRAVASGLYLIGLESGSLHQTRKMMLLR